MSRPKTWAQFLADCAALKAHGITPIGMGNKDGYFGAWMFAIFAKQALSSLNELTQTIGSNATVSQSPVGKILQNLYTAMQNLVKKGYVNPDVSSLDLTQGWQIFPQKRAAMSFATDGQALSWAKTLGDANIGVAAPPDLGQRQAREHLRRHAVLRRVHHQLVEEQAPRLPRSWPGCTSRPT